MQQNLETTTDLTKLFGIDYINYDDIVTYEYDYAQDYIDMLKTLVANNNAHNYFNSVRSELIFNLSKNNRLKIPPHTDMFDTFEVSLFPGEKIESAILYIGICVPKDEALFKEFAKNGTLTDKEKAECLYDPNKCKILYIELERIEKPSGKFKFFQNPLPLFIHNNQFIFSVEINFERCEGFNHKEHKIKMGSYIIDSNVRNNIKNYNLVSFETIVKYMLN